MSTVTHLIKKNAEEPVTLAAAGITYCAPSYKANGVDTLVFSQSRNWLAASGWPHLTKVALLERTVDGETTTDRCLFVGWVEGIPRQAAGGGSQSLTYTAYGPAYALQRCDYSQEWTYTKDDGTTGTAYEPTVVLGEDNNGTRLTSGQVISHAAAYAISRGVPIDLGTVAAGVAVPIDERDNIKVWDAAVAMLSYTPDYVLWFDYDHQVDGVYVPALNLTAPGSMTAVTKALIGATAEGARFDPRYDIQVPGIQITYRWTGEYDGRTVKSRYVDSAGDVDDYRRVSLVYDLEGSRSVFVSQDVEVQGYPADWTDATGKAALVALIPTLAQLPLADWSVTSVTRAASVHAYASRLLSGSVPAWTGKHTERDTFAVRIAYSAYASDTDHLLEEGSKDFTFTAVSTDAITKTYRKQSEWVEAETVPAGLAAALYASWNRLHYDGQVTFHEQRALFDMLPGMLLRCTGGLTEWETMDAVIQDVSVDLATGTTTVRVGTCGRLQADNLLAIFRAARGRRFSLLRLGRDDGDATDGNQVEGAEKTPNDTVASGVPPCLRQRFAVEAKNANDTLHRVEISPASLSPDDIGTPEDIAQTLELRPIELMEKDGPTEAGDARVAIYKAYALVSVPTFDRHEVLSAIPEPGAINVAAPLVWSSTTLTLQLAAEGGLTVTYSGQTLVGLALEGSPDILAFGSTNDVGLYVGKKDSSTQATYNFKKLGTNGGLEISETSGATGFRLKGTTDTAPGNYKVYGTNGSGELGWLDTVAVEMS
jgi:hypothetical protein